MIHSKAFWLEIGKVYPAYRDAVKWLQENGSQIMFAAEQVSFFNDGSPPSGFSQIGGLPVYTKRNVVTIIICS